MITCPNCGAQNDDANRFCDQCGSRLDAAATPAPTPGANAPATQADPTPAPAMLTCPSCGAQVVPGEAFCSECGASLSDLALPRPTLSDAPTMLAPAPAVTEMAAVSTTESHICPVCGHQNLPGDSYCENCGVDLATTVVPPDSPNVSAPEAVEAPIQPDAPTSVIPAQPDAITETPIEPPAAVAAETQIAEPTPAAPAEQSPITPEAEAPEPAKSAPVEPETAPPPSTPTAPPPAPTPTSAEEETIAVPAPTPPPSPTPVSAEERQHLEKLVAAHRDTVSQYEQMLARYPAGEAPVFLTAGLDEAQRALAEAEADLSALPSGPDPAEVARLQGLVTAHHDTVSQYEQMLARYPAGEAPAFLTAGLDEARRALAEAEAELTALAGSAAAPAVPAPTPEAPTAAAPPPAPTPAPPQPQAVVGPRLALIDGNKEVALPSGKTEIIIGREDPVSSIFPEIDLTPFGGESGGVSRQHARLNLVNGQWVLTDLNSTNYTRVDGSRLEPNVATPIQDGAKLQFGRIVLIFHT